MTDLPEWATGWFSRPFRGIIEAQCEHGVGHPHFEKTVERFGETRDGWGVHGCDGCCQEQGDEE